MRNRLVIIAVLVCVVFSFFLFSTPQRAQLVPVYTVRNTSDTVVAGACTANTSGCSLRGAMQQAAIGASVIRFAIPGCETCVINLTSPLPDLSTSNTSINGPGADKLMVRRANGIYRIFNVTATGTVGISGLTITNGFASGSNGGGIANGSGTLNIANSMIRSNQVSGGAGGGISNLGGTVTLTNSTIDSNSANSLGSGGNIFNGAGGVLNVINCTISSGVAGAGGGIFNGGGTGTSVAHVVNSTLYGNFAGQVGGAAFNSGNGILTVFNSTLATNVVNGVNADRGGGVDNLGTARVKSSLIALNSAPSGPDVSGTYDSIGYNLVRMRDGSAGFTSSTDQTGTTALPLDPMLDPSGLRDNGGPTLTIALLPGSPAIDKAYSAGSVLGNLITDQRGTSFRRTFGNSAVPDAAFGNGTDIGAFELQSKTPADFDADGKTDIGIFRPSVAEWWISRSSNASVFATQFGATTDKIVPGDFTGDGKSDVAIWRPSSGEWFVLRSEDSSFFAFPFGSNGDTPAPADYDGDSKTDPAVFRPSSATWFIRRSSDNGTTIVAFGANGDQPVPADYDGDGLADIAVFRPSVGQWWLNRSTAGMIATTFGNSSDKPVQGDYTGDGKTDVAFWRPSTGEWFVLRSENFSFFAFSFGLSTDIPAPGDYDGDGRHDATVFRPSNATWFSQRTTAGTLIQQFGATGDRPIPNAFVP